MNIEEHYLVLTSLRSWRRISDSSTSEELSAVSECGGSAVGGGSGGSGGSVVGRAGRSPAMASSRAHTPLVHNRISTCWYASVTHNSSFENNNLYDVFKNFSLIILRVRITSKIKEARFILFGGHCISSKLAPCRSPPF